VYTSFVQSACVHRASGCSTPLIFCLLARRLGTIIVARSLYSQWEALEIADIALEKALFLRLYSDLLLHGWFPLGGPRGAMLWLPGAKLTTSPQWDELEITDIER
jgi:hypothetical protein